MTHKNKTHIPDLRIIPVKDIYPHEGHDVQRAEPLIERIRQADTLTNPPIVAPMDDERYVILDGSNRYHSFKALGYEHLLVQITPYDGGAVELDVWQHIVSHWERVYFINAIQDLDGIQLDNGWNQNALVRIYLRDGIVLSVMADVDSVIERNAKLCDIVEIYKSSAKLFRTAHSEPDEVWTYYPQAIALLQFQHYQPHDIIEAATLDAYLPAGVSRHIIQGRALMLNYPLASLKDETATLEEKNNVLQEWVKSRFDRRAVRFYAESSYQFSE